MRTILSVARLSLAASIAAFALSSNPAAASTVQIGSYVGTSDAPTFINSCIAVGTAGGPCSVVAYPGSGYTSLAPATYVSFTSGSNVANGTTDYFTTFSGAGITSGSLTFQADDMMQVFLNNVQIGQTGSIYSTLVTDPLTGLTAGTNTLEFVVENTLMGPTGFDALGTLTSNVSTTPEPGSLALLGTGMLGIVGVARRRWSN